MVADFDTVAGGRNYFIQREIFVLSTGCLAGSAGSLSDSMFSHQSIAQDNRKYDGNISRVIFNMESASGNVVE